MPWRFPTSQLTGSWAGIPHRCCHIRAPVAHPRAHRTAPWNTGWVCDYQEERQPVAPRVPLERSLTMTADVGLGRSTLYMDYTGGPSQPVSFHRVDTVLCYLQR